MAGTSESKAGEKGSPKPRRKAVDGSGGASSVLGGLTNLSDLLGQPTGVANDEDRRLELDLDLIDPDPNQPRKFFDENSLKELAATIGERGVKQPISVRKNPEIEGRYIINHGERRWRASRIAGRTSVPAFLDGDYSEADQVIENLQRDELTPREIAEFIGRQIAKGTKKGDIAKQIGKSPAFVTQHVTLLDLPDPIAEVFQSGRTKDVTVINELVFLYKRYPEGVTTWLEFEEQEITRSAVKLLREQLETEGEEGRSADAEDDKAPDADAGGGEAEAEEKEPKPDDPTKLKKALVTVEHDGRPARLVLTRRPSTMGAAWIKYDDDGAEVEVELETVRLLAIIEG